MPQSEFSTERNPSPDLSAAHPAVPQFGGFAADWHPCLGQGLAHFPRCLPLPVLAWDLAPRTGEPAESAGPREPAARAQQLAAEPPEICWPDFATFVEDDSGRQMMYYPASSSPWSVCVLFCVASGSWHTQLYFDADPV